MLGIRVLFSTLVLLTSLPIMAQVSSLSLWTSSENVKKAVEAAARPFEKEFKVKLQIEILTKDLTTQFKTAALAGKGPDIFAWAHDMVGELVTSGLLESITLSNAFKERFLPVAINGFTYKNKLYGYPYDIEAVALIYNKALVYEVPKNMESLIEFATNFNKKAPGDSYGFLYDYSNFFFSFPFFTAGGGYIFYDGKSGINVNDIGLANEGAVNAGKLLYQLVSDQVIPESTNRNIAIEKMKNQKLAMTIDGPWSIKDLRNSGVDFGVAPIPPLNGGKPKPFVGIHGFMIRRSSSNKLLAKELIENYLVSDKGLAMIFKMDPRIPPLKNIAHIIDKEPSFQGFLASASNGIPMPNVPEMGAVWGTMAHAIKLIIKGNKKPEAALSMAKDKILKTINRD